MPVSENKPVASEEKPAGAPLASGGVAPGGTKSADKASTAGSQGLSVNDSRLNNQVNVYGDGPDSGKKTLEAEVAEKRQAKIDKINDSSSDVLAGAAQSGNADVHNLLGQRSIAELNGDEEELKRIDADIAAQQKQTSR